MLDSLETSANATPYEIWSLVTRRPELATLSQSIDAEAVYAFIDSYARVRSVQRAARTWMYIPVVITPESKKRRNNTTFDTYPVEFENTNPNGSEVSSRSGSIHCDLNPIAKKS